MNGVRFYLEFDTRAQRRRGEHMGTVFAAFVANGRNHAGGFDGVGAILAEPNSPVANTGTSFAVQHSYRMKRIPEKLAREIHPALFECLDNS